MTVQSFYHAFEADFRGSRDEIMDRLKVYLPFVLPLVHAGGAVRAFDMGCGRGEWLELMATIGMPAQGVDLDDGMLEDCASRNLDARKKDALAALRALPDASCTVITGFHIAEHLPFTVLREVVAEALRALTPGGVLILETPNAENIGVATLSFHIDPTHVRPLPPALLAFLPRFYGFARQRVMRLQESKTLAASSHATLHDVLHGTSPDYAVIAQKQGDADVLSRVDSAFDADCGLTQDTLIERYEADLARQGDVAALRAEMGRLSEEVTRLSADSHRMAAEIDQHAAALAAAVKESTMDAALAAVVKDNAIALADLRGAVQTRDELINSTSWRVTQPLRAMATWARQARQVDRSEMRSVVKSAASRVVRMTAGVVFNTPVLEKPARRLMLKFPAISNRLKGLALAAEQTGTLAAANAGAQITHESQLSPKARAVYARLHKTFKE